MSSPSGRFHSAPLAVSSPSREVDISAIPGLLRVEKVWWDYDESAPGYPPNWRQFEVWPGAILYIDDSDVPTAGDVVRIWYKRLRTINGLDSATATTLPAQDEALIVAGGAGFVTQERVQEQPQRTVPRKLREWADARLREFERGLGRVARRQAARHSGIASIPALDRWDDGSGWS